MMQSDLTSLSDASDVHCYAVRRVNPFLGVMQIIETTGGRAISTNGVVWDIEVRAEYNSAWGSLNKNNHEIAFYRYGLWSKLDGLVSRPLAPQLDKDPLADQCAFLINSVKQRLELLPFPLQDSQELWLFDSTDTKLLALLASTTLNAKRPSPEPKYWSSHIGADGVPSQYKFPEASELIVQIETAAGFNIKKYWINRLPDGGGMNELNNEVIAKESFPPFLITEDWFDAEQSRLVSDYIEWIAPCLLTLQNLTIQQRTRLEEKLYIQAISIEHHRNLYTEVIDEKYITSAMVQCKLQKANL